MRFPIVRIIWRKELREALRDRRTLFMMIGIPLIVYPLAMIGMSRLQEGQEASQAARTSRVAVWGQLTPDLQAKFGASKVELVPWGSAPAEVRRALESGEFAPPAAPPMDLEAPEKRPEPRKIPDTPWAKAAQSVVLSRQVDAVLLPWPGFAQAVADGREGMAMVLFDSVRPESQRARGRVGDTLRAYREYVRANREKAKGLSAGFVNALDIRSQNVAPESRRTGMLLGILLPYALIAFSIMSGFYAAIDMTAGEKERGTMQTLLCAPVDSLEIVTGKYLAVWVISLIASVVNLCSLAFTFSRLNMIPGLRMTVSPLDYLVALVMLIPVSLMVTGLYLALGAFARDFKDGQNYLTPLLLGLMMPLIITMTPGIELNAQLAFVPIINIALFIRTVFLGEWRAEMLFLVTLSSFCYAALGLVFASKVFQQNNLLLGGKQNIGSVLDFSRRPGSRPTPGVSVLLFCVTLVLAFYGTVLLERRGLPLMLACIQYGFFLAPTLFLVWSKGYDVREVLSLRPIRPRAALGALLIGISGWAVASGIFLRLLPPPESLRKAMERLLMLGDKPEPLWVALFFIALTPAICEEALFRGVILSGFRSLGKWESILLTGLLFGLAHASIYRLSPTFFLGVLFGYAVWQTRSLAAGVICHLLNNGLMVLIARNPDVLKGLGLEGAQQVPWSIVGVALVLLLAGIWLVGRGGEPLTPPLQPAAE